MDFSTEDKDVIKSLREKEHQITAQRNSYRCFVTKDKPLQFRINLSVFRCSQYATVVCQMSMTSV